MTISTSIGPMQRATSAALTFNTEIARSALACSLDALSFALEAVTFRSPNDLIEASARHAQKQLHCFETQSSAYGALVGWSLGELSSFGGWGIPPTGKETAAEQDDDEALLFKLME